MSHFTTRRLGAPAAAALFALCCLAEPARAAAVTQADSETVVQAAGPEAALRQRS